MVLTHPGSGRQPRGVHTGEESARLPAHAFFPQTVHEGVHIPALCRAAPGAVFS